MRITVLGLGYVGAVTSACLARDGHAVLGVDTDAVKVELMAGGRSPIVEAGVSEITARAVADGSLRVREDLGVEAVDADVIFICVGTPTDADGRTNLAAIERVTEDLGQALRSSPGRPVIALRSTVPPGTTEGLVLPALERISGRRQGQGFELCFQPEFLREGSSVEDFDNPPYTVVGGGEAAALPLRRLFGRVGGQFMETSVRTAEVLKLASNAFHAVKVVFANEIGRLAQGLGVDSREVMRLIGEDRQLNLSTAYLRPGFAFGGSCLPKDLRALVHTAQRHAVRVPMLEEVLPSNRAQIEHAAELVLTNGHRRIGLIGLAFKPNTDDLRESPLVFLARNLIDRGVDLAIYDPWIEPSALRGANRAFIDEAIPDLGSRLAESLEALVRHAEALVVGHPCPELGECLSRSETAVLSVVDLVGVDPCSVAPAVYRGICW